MEKTGMRDLVTAFQKQPVMARMAAVLDRVIPDRELHARFLNSLARMEYVGCRKILKSRRAEHIDCDGIRHAIEEMGHALRLKRAALEIAGDEDPVATFADEHTLAGREGEDYMQFLDRAAEASLQDLDGESSVQINYLLTSAAIEVRAEAFYPLYEERLRAHGAPFSVAAIQKDEQRHLAEMEARLGAELPNWKVRLNQVLKQEPAALALWLDALERALDASEKKAAPTAGAV